MNRYNDDYDIYDAMADEADEKKAEVMEMLASDKIREDWDAGSDLCLALDVGEAREADYPRPWVWVRHLADIYDQGGDDGLDEYLREHYADEIEEAYDEWCYDNSGPCCNSFSCPCGNSNNYPG